MPIEEAFCLFKGISFDEGGVTVGERHGEVVTALQFAIEVNIGLSKIHLCFARGMGQGNKALSRSSLFGLQVVLDDRVAAGEPLLVTEAFVDSLSGVSLFLVNAFVLFQDGIDEAFVGVELGWAGVG